MTFDPCKPVQTKVGIPVTLISVVGRDPWPLVGYVGASSVTSHWESNGRSREGDGDLINTPEPKRSGEVWVNVYWSCNIPIYGEPVRTKKGADSVAAPGRIACICKPWTEGEGLELGEGRNGK